MGGVEGARAVQPERHGLDVDAQHPRRVGARPGDQRRGVHRGDRDVVLAFDFVDGLGGGFVSQVVGGCVGLCGGRRTSVWR